MKFDSDTFVSNSAVGSKMENDIIENIKSAKGTTPI